MGRITDSLQAPGLSSIVLRTLTPGKKVHAKKADGLTRLDDEWEHISGTRTLPVLSLVDRKSTLGGFIVQQEESSHIHGIVHL